MKSVFMHAVLLSLLCAAAPATATLDVPSGMILVPGGTLDMGLDAGELEILAEIGRDVPHMCLGHATHWFSNEIPLHDVVVDAFFLDAREVTNARFRVFVEESGYQAEGDWEKFAGSGREEHPVVQVSWADARAYARWAGKRLPAEAEWEWAARGGTERRWFPWGDEFDDYELANYGHDRTFWAGLKRLVGFQKIKTVPVASYAPNSYGLCDMVGNAAEWCEDAFLPYPEGPAETQPWDAVGYRDHPQRIVRGGSWESPNPVFVRLNHRAGRAPKSAEHDVGFRCAMSLP